MLGFYPDPKGRVFSAETYWVYPVAEACPTEVIQAGVGMFGAKACPTCPTSPKDESGILVIAGAETYWVFWSCLLIAIPQGFDFSRKRQPQQPAP